MQYYMPPPAGRRSRVTSRGLRVHRQWRNSNQQHTSARAAYDEHPLDVPLLLEVGAKSPSAGILARFLSWPELRLLAPIYNQEEIALAYFLGRWAHFLHHHSPLEVQTSYSRCAQRETRILSACGTTNEKNAKSCNRGSTVREGLLAASSSNMSVSAHPSRCNALSNPAKAHYSPSPTCRCTLPTTSPSSIHPVHPQQCPASCDHDQQHLSTTTASTLPPIIVMEEPVAADVVAAPPALSSPTLHGASLPSAWLPIAASIVGVIVCFLALVGLSLALQ